MSLSFVAVDFETANSESTSICEIAFAKYVNGEPTDVAYSLIRPEGDLYVAPMNELIHGISAEDLIDAPMLKDVWEEFNSFIGELPIVGHNATQDLKKLLQVISENNLHISDRDFYCTLTLARNHPGISPEEGYKLEFLADELDVDWNVTTRPSGMLGHSAVLDAATTAELFLKIVERTNGNVNALLAEFTMKPGRIESGQVLHGNTKIRPKVSFPKKLTAKEFQEMVSNFSDAEKTFAQGHPLNGMQILLTLSPEEIDENQFWLMVGMCGAEMKTGVSKKLNILVECEGDPTGRYVPGQTGKSLDARKLNGEGKAEIQLISEREFLDLVGPEIIEYVRNMTE